MSKTMTGSEIALSGFQNEFDLVEILKSPSREIISGIEKLVIHEQTIAKVAKVTGSKKPDVELFIEQEKKNISVKKYQTDKGRPYSHVARTSVDKFVDRFDLSVLARQILYVFTGERKPYHYRWLLKDQDITQEQRRIIISDLKEEYLSPLLEELSGKSMEILEWAFLGEEKEVDGFIFSEQNNGLKTHRFFTDKEVMDFYKGKDSSCKVSARGSLTIGEDIIIQRKGGKGSPTNVQIKFNPHKIVLEDKRKYKGNVNEADKEEQQVSQTNAA